MMRGLAKHRTSKYTPEHGNQSKRSTATAMWIILCLICFAVGKMSNYTTTSNIVSGIINIKPAGKKPHATISRKDNLIRIRAMRTAAQDLIDMLEEYYNGQDQAKKMMLDTWLSSWEFNSTSKLVDTMARAIVTEDQDEFIIGVIGSSVAAGNGNCAYDNYPEQLERTFSSVWLAGGMKLVVQNTGNGQCKDSHGNQVYCIQHLLSPETDIVQYTWTYYETVAGEVSEKALESRESLIRWCQLLRHQPPVHVMNIGKLPADRSNIEYNFSEYYSKYSYNAFYAKSAYDEVADVNENFLPGHIGDGYHNSTRYGRNETDADRKGSLGVMMRNWHPGPLYFQIIADTYTYVYSKAVLKALDLIEDEISINNLDPRETFSASKRPVILKSSLPTPMFCDPLYCVVNEPPTCFYLGSPTFGLWGARVEDPNDDLNPHKGELQNWTLWADNSSVIEYTQKGDREFFQKRNDVQSCDHKWSCNDISATSVEHGSVVFRLPKSEVGLVVICGTEFLTNTAIEIKYNGQVLDRSTLDLWPISKCVRLLKKFSANSAVARTGHEYLSIKVLNQTDKVQISHVITL